MRPFGVGRCWVRGLATPRAGGFGLRASVQDLALAWGGLRLTVHRVGVIRFEGSESFRMVFSWRFFRCSMFEE